jgi:4-hydroxythreonine-4-phosphate dehydrogenase
MTTRQLPVIAVTMGDPCGVGPEIVAKALADPRVQSSCRTLVLGDPAVMSRALRVVASPLPLVVLSTPQLPPTGGGDAVHLLPLTALAAADMHYGQPSLVAGEAVYRYIAAAVDLCQQGTVAAMATAPINKEALNRAGHHYPGHTELLAQLTGTRRVVMMLAGDRLRVTLVTIHEALTAVPRLLTVERILETVRITARDLRRYVTPAPRLAVLALNPHGGEGGLFGSEEQQVIRPAIEQARAEGIDAVGPLSADTLFHFAAQGAYDAVVCMYHDQGLIPLKLLHFDDGINVTLGLPIIRTSVDHGTAYDLAGTGRASAGSMTAAILAAAQMAMVKQAEIGA